MVIEIGGECGQGECVPRADEFFTDRVMNRKSTRRKDREKSLNLLLTKNRPYSLRLTVAK